MVDWHTKVRKLVYRIMGIGHLPFWFCFWAGMGEPMPLLLVQPVQSVSGGILDSGYIPQATRRQHLRITLASECC